MSILENQTPFSFDDKVLFFDIETTPTKGWAFRNYEANVFEIEEYFHIQSYSYKWGEKGKTKCVALPDFPLYKKEPHNDLELVKSLFDLWSKADIIIGYNGDRFDIKKTRHRFLIHGLGNVYSFKTIDPLKIAKKLGFFSNSLNGVSDELGLGKKVEHEGNLWKKCYDAYLTNDKKSWKKMKEYNNQDIELLYLVSRRLIPYMERYPRVKMDNGKCPVCGGTNFKRNGKKYYSNYEQQRYACLKCGFGNIYGDKIKKEWDIKQ